MNKRKRIFANKMHREMFFLIAFASLVPMFLACVALFHLIFSITAEQVGIPEAIASNLFPAARRVIVIVWVITPAVISMILVFSYKVTHQLVGPYDRILRELEECLAGTRLGPIVIRQKDKFTPLVDKINGLLERLKTGSKV